MSGVTEVEWFKRFPQGGTAYRKPETRDAAVALGSKVIRYVEEPCCAVPLDEESPECWRHGYRSLMVKMAELLPHVHQVETQAQVHALEFVRRDLVATAQQEAADGYSGIEVMEKLVHRLNQLITKMKEG
jgi:hypothetical protein